MDLIILFSKMIIINRQYMHIMNDSVADGIKHIFKTWYIVLISIMN